MPKYKDNILYYCRSVDDILITWTNTSLNNYTFESFKQDLNKTCCLDWITGELGEKVNFLDLTFTLNAKTGRFDTRTFQKIENIYQYITFNSAHLKETIEIMIFSLLLTYFKHNTYHEDFIHFANLLFSRLQVRGYYWIILKKMFKTAGEKIDERHLNKYKNLNAKRETYER